VAVDVGSKVHKLDPLIIVQCAHDVVVANADASPIPSVVSKAEFNRSQHALVLLFKSMDRARLLVSVTTGNLEFETVTIP
jgi:hypothetical protein